MDAITSAVHELATLNVRILSPADPRIVAAQGEFLFVASDPIRSVRLVQDRHLESIKAANFLWLVCPDGYVGQSASMEIGYAAAVGVPIFAMHLPGDLTLRQYVRFVPSLAEAVRTSSVGPQRRRIPGVLIDPRASVEKAHHILDRIAATLTRRINPDEPALLVHDDVGALQRTITLPTYLQ
jgi:hypothetical protein